MTPHETSRPTRPDTSPPPAPPTRPFGPQGPTLGDLIDAYLQDYQVRQFRSVSTARGRTAHLAAFFGRDARATALTTYQIRQYQRARRAAAARAQATRPGRPVIAAHAATGRAAAAEHTHAPPLAGKCLLLHDPRWSTST